MILKKEIRGKEHSRRERTRKQMKEDKEEGAH